MSIATELAPQRRGRPRDASVDARVLRAAQELFAVHGWHGFSFEQVAKLAGVGKSSLYRRWRDREALFLQALSEAGFRDTDIDTGAVRTDLLALARNYGAWLEGPNGPVGLRITLETRMNRDFARVVRRAKFPSVTVSHQIVRRAKARGELPADASTAVILEGVLGGVAMHLITSGKGGPAFDSASGDRFLTRLVGYVLDGASRL